MNDVKLEYCRLVNEIVSIKSDFCRLQLMLNEVCREAQEMYVKSATAEAVPKARL